MLAGLTWATGSGSPGDCSHLQAHLGAPPGSRVLVGRMPSLWAPGLHAALSPDAHWPESTLYSLPPGPPQSNSHMVAGFLTASDGEGEGVTDRATVTELSPYQSRLPLAIGRKQVMGPGPHARREEHAMTCLLGWGLTRAVPEWPPTPDVVCPHFAHGETEAQRGQVTCPQLQSPSPQAGDRPPAHGCLSLAHIGEARVAAGAVTPGAQTPSLK